MNIWPALLALAGIAAAALPGRPSEEWTVIIGGDTNGYLSPCGCTKPMTGGIRRRATAVETLRQKDRTLILENGGLVGGQSRQDELKAEAMAEFLATIGTDAIHITPSEAKLGRGMLLSLGNLAEDRLVTSSLQKEEDLPVKQTIVKGPFLVGGITIATEAVALPLEARSIPVDTAVRTLVERAEATGKSPILMLAGSLEDAKGLARKHPALQLIVYRSTGSPAAEPAREGETLLVSPGERGQHVLSLSFEDGRFGGYRKLRLDPSFDDQRQTQAIFTTYLKRVEEEDLLGKAPRVDGPGFAGTKKCGSCHQKAMGVWQTSEHSHALASLEKEGQGRDPECVGCHVVGVKSLRGFVSRSKTPHLADVGCESCHGAGAAHAANPLKVKLAAATEKNCLSCHDVENSPNFNFATYWPKIRH